MEGEGFKVEERKKGKENIPLEEKSQPKKPQGFL